MFKSKYSSFRLERIVFYFVNAIQIQSADLILLAETKIPETCCTELEFQLITILQICIQNLISLLIFLNDIPRDMYEVAFYLTHI